MSRPWYVAWREWELRGGWHAERHLVLACRARAISLWIVLCAVALCALALSADSPARFAGGRMVTLENWRLE